MFKIRYWSVPRNTAFEGKQLKYIVDWPPQLEAYDGSVSKRMNYDIDFLILDFKHI